MTKDGDKGINDIESVVEHWAGLRTPIPPAALCGGCVLYRRTSMTRQVHTGQTVPYVRGTYECSTCVSSSPRPFDGSRRSRQPSTRPWLELFSYGAEGLRGGSSDRGEAHPAARLVVLGGPVRAQAMGGGGGGGGERNSDD